MPWLWPSCHLSDNVQTRNVSLISAAGLTSIHTSLDRTTSAGKAALTGDPSIDFAAAAAAHASGAAPMASIAGRATAASTQERTASEDPSNATDESSLDDSSDEDDATSRPRQPVAAGADIGGAGEVATGVPSRPQHGRHERHASFQAWAGSYAGPPSRGTDDDDGDIVMASSPHAECMQIGAGAMHDEEVRKSMEAARLVEALEATGLQEGGVTAAEGVGGAGGLLEGGELEGEGGVRGSSGGGAAPQGTAQPLLLHLLRASNRGVLLCAFVPASASFLWPLPGGACESTLVAAHLDAVAQCWIL